MIKKIILLQPVIYSFIFLLGIGDAIAQNKLAIETKFGTGNTKLDYIGNFNDLVASTTDRFFFSLGLVKSLDKGFSYGFEFEYYRFDLYLTYTPLDPLRNLGGPRFDYFAFGPKVQKDLFVFPKAGLSFSTALHLTNNAQSDYEYSGGELQAIRLPNGQPRIPVEIYGQRSIEELAIHIKPEVGLFYDLTAKSRLTLSAKWGLDLREPSIVIDLNRIEFENQTYQNKYFFSGNYFSTLLGYRYSF
jgi:hypothetical protein